MSVNASSIVDKVTWLRSNDLKAEAIAKSAQEWYASHLRSEDITVSRVVSICGGYCGSASRFSFSASPISRFYLFIVVELLGSALAGICASAAV